MARVLRVATPVVRVVEMDVLWVVVVGLLPPKAKDTAERVLGPVVVDEPGPGALWVGRIGCMGRRGDPEAWVWGLGLVMVLGGGGCLLLGFEWRIWWDLVAIVDCGGGGVES